MRTLDKIFASEEPQSILIYGPAKAGKTYTVASIVKAGYNVLWLDCERGIRTLKQVLTQEEQQRVVYIAVPDTNTNPVAIATVGRLFSARQPQRVCYSHGVVGCGHADCKGPDAAFTFNPAELDSDWCVVVDSLTQVSDSALAHATKEMQGNLLATHSKADWDAYAYQGQLLKSLLSNMQQAKYHRVFITHEDVIDQADGTELIFPVCGTRAFSRTVARYFDHIVYLYKQNRQHCSASSTTFKNNVMAGSRSGLAVESGADLVDLLRGTSKEAVAARKTAEAPAGAGAAKPGGAVGAKLGLAGAALAGLKK